MAGGLFALLDDVAAFARLAAASTDDIAAAAGRASTKTAGVIVDDAAVTPQYVTGLGAERELPIIKKIAKGSIRNKLVFILPVALLLSQFLPWLLTPILMIGGAYLCFEGAEKVWHKIRPADKQGEHGDDTKKKDPGFPQDEDTMVRGAVRTDLILSAEIMVIALNEVADEGFVSRALILVVVAFLITAVVYGAVALIVKADDLGLNLAQRDSAGLQRIGLGLVNAMPKVMVALTVIGTVAMLWVGGHIWLVGLEDLGWTAPYDLVHDLEKAVADATGAIGGVLAWLINTTASAILGAIIGAVVIAALSVLPERFRPGH